MKEIRRSVSDYKVIEDKQLGSHRVQILRRHRKAVHFNFCAKELPGKCIRIFVF